jgi:hypothetical protein
MHYTFWCRERKARRGRGSAAAPAGGKEGALESHEALPGTAVRVRHETRRTEFGGMRGIIEQSFGSAEHPALDVRLENGRLELFWFYQLDRAVQA